MPTPQRQATRGRKLGFADTDRLSPEHDQIMHWLDNGATTLIRALVEPDVVDDMPDWYAAGISALQNRGSRLRADLLRAFDAWEEHHASSTSEPGYQLDRMRKEREQVAAWNALGDSPPFVRAKVCRRVWEQALTNRSAVIGFADLVIYWERTLLPEIQAARKFDEQGIEYLDRQLVTLSRSGFWWSLDYFPYLKPARLIGECYIEVKSAILTVSELLRQLRYYQNYCEGPWFVCSPDWRHAQVLLDQGIGFIPYTPGAAPVVYEPGACFDKP